MKKTLIFFTAALLHLTAFSQQKLIDANNDFAFRIYKSTKPDSSNFFISPLSLNIALAIANEGAASLTRQEMDNLLSLNGVGERASLYRQLIQRTTDLNDEDFKFCLQLMEGKGTNSLTIANSLWVNDACKMDDHFRKSIQTNYNSDVFSFNKSDIESANKNLNAWISEKTNDKITEMPGVDSSVMLSIVNAIHFVGEWDVQFDLEETTKKKFHALDKKKIDADYMHIQSHYKYYEDGDIQSIHLPI